MVEFVRDVAVAGVRGDLPAGEDFCAVTAADAAGDAEARCGGHTADAGDRTVDAAAFHGVRESGADPRRESYALAY
jgi:hypothetical protein